MGNTSSPWNASFPRMQLVGYDLADGPEPNMFTYSAPISACEKDKQSEGVGAP